MDIAALKAAAKDAELLLQMVEVYPVRMETMAAERAAFLSLARTQHRISWQYRKWALEEKARGNTAKFLHYAAEARRLWRDCKEHISYARLRNPA